MNMEPESLEHVFKGAFASKRRVNTSPMRASRLVVARWPVPFALSPAGCSDRWLDSGYGCRYATFASAWRSRHLPNTSNIRERMFLPTGAFNGPPVSSTAMPRARPCVGVKAIPRT
jgi:hypothetical protein